jgi:hypothetical protein
MNRASKKIFQNIWNGRLAAAFVLLALTSMSLSAVGASAGCAVPLTGKLPAGASATVTPPPPARAPFVQPKAVDDWDGFDPHPIVGLWHLNYTAETVTGATGIFPPAPPSFPFLESYKTWHRDGTEFEQAFFDPKVGNICFGVWKEIGERTVKLHHIGLMFNTDGSVKAVFTSDEIDVVAANGLSYSGSFTFRLYSSTDVYGTGSAIVTVTGKTAGTRITVDQ